MVINAYLCKIKNINNKFNYALMFYAPDLLSLKNKTEISIVYYISTTKKYRRINKRNASKINIENIINDIMEPKIPFSLRLYAYLLNGIVKIWLMKIEWFSLTTKICKKNPLKKSKSEIKLNYALRNPNLEIEDIYLDDVKENLFYDGNCDNLINEYVNNTISSIEMVGKQTDLMNGYVDNTISSIEMARKQSSSIIMTDPKIKNKIDRIDRIDEINTLSSHDMFNKKKKISSKIEFTNYLKGRIIDLMNQSIKNIQIIQNNNIENNNIEEIESCMDLNSFPNSIEEWRISDSKLNEFRQSNEYNQGWEHQGLENQGLEHQGWETEETPRSKKAQWFYNILVQASEGKITIIQDKPFGEVITRIVN